MDFLQGTVRSSGPATLRRRTIVAQGLNNEGVTPYGDTPSPTG